MIWDKMTSLHTFESYYYYCAIVRVGLTHVWRGHSRVGLTHMWNSHVGLTHVWRRRSRQKLTHMWRGHSAHVWRGHLRVGSYSRSRVGVTCGGTELDFTFLIARLQGGQLTDDFVHQWDVMLHNELAFYSRRCVTIFAVRGHSRVGVTHVFHCYLPHCSQLEGNEDVVLGELFDCF